MKEIVAGIYQIVNLMNGNMYIGSSSDIPKRWRGHCHLLNKNKHHSPHLQHAWNKYGSGSFEFRIVEYCQCVKEVLIEREQYYIDLWRPVYNIAPNAVNGLGQEHSQEFKDNMSLRMKGHKYNIGRKASEETRLKMSIARKGTKASDETKAKLSAIQRGRFVSEETRARQSENSARKGKPGYWTGAVFSEERLERMSISHFGNRHSQETRDKMSLISKSRSQEYLLEIAERKRATWRRKKEIQENQDE